MSLTREEVLHLAQLSNLSITDEELDGYIKELSPVVDYFNELKEVNTDQVLPTSQTTGLIDILRTDSVDEVSTLSQDASLQEAPETHNGYIVTPLILTKDTA